MTALADAPIGKNVQIARVALEGEAAAWIGAVGLSEGEELVVLRRAAFGGPLHVRTASGGEFAVGREVARQISVETPDAPR
ncbi:MAG: hypothetical protein JWP97_1229 [Labilithrix sp.]|nr:hypothetical protein [Labilithrix sp.]